MRAWPHQIELAGKGLPILLTYNILYLAMEERTGKTLTSIIIAENIAKVKRVLVLTKKKALKGWEDTLAAYDHDCEYVLSTHQSAHKVKGKFDLVIADEAHTNISGYPKRSKTWDTIRKLCVGLPIIYMSATPKAQGTQLLFNQFAISSYSPWKQYKDYYAWFQDYAKRDAAGNIPTTRITADRIVVNYQEIKHEEAWADIEHLFLTRTRAELGFEQEPEDKVHFIELSEPVKNIYNHLMKKKVLTFDLASTGKEYKLVCDSGIKLRWALHMLEGGTLKIDNESIDLGNHEKVDYIKKTWGDTENLVIMYHYQADKIKLEKNFKNALLLQATSNAEGVDLSMYKDLVIYSQDFSTAKHTQRRARQANMKREEEIIVHYLLVKNAISHQVYKTCSQNKKNFVDSVFERIEL